MLRIVINGRLELTARLAYRSSQSTRSPIPIRNLATSTQQASQPTSQPDETNQEEQKTTENLASKPDPTLQRKTMAQLDEELRQKMSGLSGDGGEAGVEYEDGQPVAMKRSVKDNMFRYI